MEILHLRCLLWIPKNAKFGSVRADNEFHFILAVMTQIYLLGREEVLGEKQVSASTCSKILFGKFLNHT